MSSVGAPPLARRAFRSAPSRTRRRPREHHGADVVVGRDLGQRVVQGGDELGVECVLRLGAIQRERRYRALALHGRTDAVMARASYRGIAAPI